MPIKFNLFALLLASVLLVFPFTVCVRFFPLGNFHACVGAQCSMNRTFSTCHNTITNSHSSMIIIIRRRKPMSLFQYKLLFNRIKLLRIWMVDHVCFSVSIRTPSALVNRNNTELINTSSPFFDASIPMLISNRKHIVELFNFSTEIDYWSFDLCFFSMWFHFNQQS